MQSDFVNVHIFDCDGVILNSNELKIKALEYSLEAVGCPTKFIIWAIHKFRLNFGQTRSMHFKFFEENNPFNKFKFTPEMSIKALKLYGEQVMSLYFECEIIEETYAYLLELPSNQPIFVVSASDQEELKSILPNRIPKMASTNIFGGPTGKVENIRYILDTFGYEGAVMYGDSVKDGLAAAANDIHFCGLTKYSADPKSLVSYCKENNSNVYEHCLQISL